MLLLLFLVNFIDGFVVDTSYGKIRGSEIIHDGKLFHSFKKIPYASPPLGNLRFQKPENPKCWNGILDGTIYGPACLSNSTVSHSSPRLMDEDCLHLNVFASDFCLKSDESCAVAFYIHGGNLNYDSAVMFDDSTLLKSFAARDVILVTTQFRLGIFSHLIFENQENVPYNIAFFDILQALDFVHKEIWSFGGDPAKVTLFGHSFGGAISSLFLFSSEINQDLSLFQKVISMSSVANFLPKEILRNLTEELVEKAACQSEHDSEVLQCLQKMNALELLRIQRGMEKNLLTTFWGVIQELPLFQKGSLADFHKNPKNIPILIGATTKELDDNLDDLPICEILGYKNEEFIYEVYKNGSKEKDLKHSDRTQRIFVDTVARVRILRDKHIPAYLYQYSNPTHPFHTDDLSYFMGVHNFNKSIDEQKLSEVYPEYFMNFIKFGKPAENWEISNGTSYFDIDWNEENGKRPQMRNGFEKEIIDYWFDEMRELDKSIEAQKSVLKYKSQTFPMPPSNSALLPWFWILLIFILGLILGKLCFSSSKKSIYVQIPGNNYNYEKIAEI
ncbi:unnamed protein product [Caenorhabditis angaria]|uniref:Carboxylesterase type B domain-containing protein n=1 Tax=Caenorhabditis angaria TaxID=860376 RepID=A0A9P1N3D3_9PELO|nr:unnamed protein product [Caenorhabditis angaria]